MTSRPSGPALRLITTVPETPDPSLLWREALGSRLRKLRLDQGEKLTETAGRAGVSPQYLSEIERGVKEPSSEMIAAVAGALDQTLGELLSAIAEDLGDTQPADIDGPTCLAA
jgi:transcriptional regulator with XRE-family HTH domain